MDAHLMNPEELDDAVARCEGFSDATAATFLVTRGEDIYSPSTDWTYGGPIIEREGIALRRAGGGWYAMHGNDTFDYANMPWCEFTTIGDKRYGKFSYETRRRRWRYEGDTPLIAAMRAYVGSKFPTYEERS